MPILEKGQVLKLKNNSVPTVNKTKIEQLFKQAEEQMNIQIYGGDNYDEVKKQPMGTGVNSALTLSKALMHSRFPEPDQSVTVPQS